jgi:DNA repair protein RadC
LKSYTATIQLPQIREATATKATSPEDVSRILRDTASFAQEAFTVLTLTTKNAVIDRHMITLGILDASLIHPREVFRPAIIDGAAAIILSHNHPSGDPTPSAEDIRITRQLIDAAHIIDIQVLDHVIIGHAETPFLSIREAGLCNFQRTATT